MAGTLGRGGAEKQLVFMAAALRAAGADVRVLTLTRGEVYEGVLIEKGFTPEWIGRRASPVARVAALVHALRVWHPHIVQAGHFYVNLHVALAAFRLGALGIGAVRNDATHDVGANGSYGGLLLRVPRALIANSHAGRSNAIGMGVHAARITVVPNVIDLVAYDAAAGGAPGAIGEPGSVVVAAVARLVAAKRLDRFLDALALARRDRPTISGVIVGDGPERDALEARAGSLGLHPHGVAFLGNRPDVPKVLAGAGALVLCSDHEGFPNVILEAMAAGIPVITSLAGDAGRIVREGATGFIVPGGTPAVLAQRMITLADDVGMRVAMGRAARGVVEAQYSDAHLARLLVTAYRTLMQFGPARVRSALGGAEPLLA